MTRLASFIVHHVLAALGAIGAAWRTYNRVIDAREAEQLAARAHDRDLARRILDSIER